MLSYCRHVAAGLDHLSKRKFVHRDLAARNILVSNDDVCKVNTYKIVQYIVWWSYNRLLILEWLEMLLMISTMSLVEGKYQSGGQHLRFV